MAAAILLIGFFCLVLIALGMVSVAKASERSRLLRNSPMPTASLDRQPSAYRQPSYRPIAALLSPAEQAFWDVLLPSLPTGVHACPKVRLIDVVRPSSRKDYSARNRVISKHLDFVLIDSATTRILAAIELDDSSHSRPGRADRDVFLEAALIEVGLPLVRFRCARTYDQERIASCLKEHLPVPAR